MMMFRYPPAGWLPLESRVDLGGQGYVYGCETPFWIEYVLVGFAWTAFGPAKLHAFGIDGAPICVFGEDPLPLRRHGWLLGGRWWPKVYHHGSPRVIIKADEAPEVSALIVPIHDDEFSRPDWRALVTEEGVRQFAENMGTVQMWDAWPDCVEHDEQAQQHHANLVREWRAWIEVASITARISSTPEVHEEPR